MKDNRSDSSVQGLDACPFTAHCLDFFDELEDRDRADGEGIVHTVRKQLNFSYLAQLRSHLHVCQFCMQAMQEERVFRTRQREQLQHWLADVELTVPTTTELILSSLTRQPHSSQVPPLSVERESAVQRGAVLASSPVKVPLFNFWQKVGSIAAVILIIFGSFNLFGRLIAWHSLQTTFLASSTAATAQKSNNRSLPTAAPTVPFDSWHNVLVTGSSAAEKSLILNYDVQTLSYQRLPLPPSSWPVSVDGVSRNGSNMLYHMSDSAGQTTFWTRIPFGSQGYFLVVKGAGNAVWMPDNRSVLVARSDGGILKVDTQNGASQLLLPTLKVAQLAFYRSPYLYFLGTGTLLENALYRINITTSSSPQQVTRQSPFTTFWLSPDGSTVYYKNNAATSSAGVFAVNSDGVNSDGTGEQVLAEDGLPVGYAADNALMLIRQNTAGQFQLVKVDAGEGSLHTVFADVAPGATALCDQEENSPSLTICDHSIALAPLGGGLVCEAKYTDGSVKLWSINLKTGRRSQLPLPANSSGLTLNLIGWDAMK